MVYLVKSILDYTDDEYTKIYSIMPESIKSKVDNKKMLINKKQTLLGYYLLKCLLNDHYNIKDYPLIDFDEYGKPYLVDMSLYFNISHSYNAVLCAVSENIIGVDIEKVVNRNRKIYSFVCNEMELKKINSDVDDSLEFTKLWTQKESYLKYLGKGLGYELKNLLTSVDMDAFDTKVKKIGEESYVLSIYEGKK